MEDLELYSRECLKVKNKAGELVPFVFNRSQVHLHNAIEDQRRRRGMVRAILGKGRQFGGSTYIAARFFQKTTTRRGVETFIMTHEASATDNLFGMVERFYQNTPLRPSLGVSNAKEMTFNKLDSRYGVGTAGSRAVGRSRTITLLHASEAAFWQNAAEHFAGVVQTVPLLTGTEVIIESTGHGPGGEFHERWQQAEAGIGDYEAIFVPWFWNEDYRRPTLESFELDDEESLYADLHKLDLAQMAWRRAKIAELRDPNLFKQEYPATPQEMFSHSGQATFIDPESVIRARQATLEGIGPLIVGIDPSRFGDDRFSIAWRKGRKVSKVESRTKIGTMEAVSWIRGMIDRDKPAKAFMDAGGGGDRIYDILVSYGAPYDKVLVLVNFGGSPLQTFEPLKDGASRGGPANRRAEMYQASKDWLEQVGGADIPDLNSLQADACAAGFSYNMDGELVIEKKEHMRARGIRSPDEWDAVILTFAEPVKEPRVSEGPRVGTRQAGELGWMAG